MSMKTWWTFDCYCGKAYKKLGWLKRHQKTCGVHLTTLTAETKERIAKVLLDNQRKFFLKKTPPKLRPIFRAISKYRNPK